jgi:sterol desaturase/sphingolipid hydroxylase (fatty acid hydroxylase superfamily)
MWAEARVMGRTSERLLHALRIKVFAHLQRLGVDYYENEMAGRIMTRMTTDVDTLSNLLQSGLLNALVLPGLLTVVASVLLLDLLKYWEHRLIHRLPLLWRFHVVHHADLDVDFTTTFRHHPLEVAFSLMVSGAAIFLFGLSPLGVLSSSILASVVPTLSHANIRWHTTADRMLRAVFMTRDAHAVHHSARKEETNSNFSLVFIWWDRLFGSYRKAPAGGLDDYEVGVEHFRTSRDLALDRVLTGHEQHRARESPGESVERAVRCRADPGV